MPTYTMNGESSSHHRPAPRGLRLAFAACILVCNAAAGEDFAQPPKWSDEVKGVFFDDAREALSGEPPTAAADAAIAKADGSMERADDAIWRDLISSAALESAVKANINRVALAVKQPARFKAGLHDDCRRDLTMLGTLFTVITSYPEEVRWKSAAPQLAQMCLRAAEACAKGTDQSLEQAQETLTVLEELLRGQANVDGEPATEQLTPEFAPLMQSMELVTEDELPEALSKQAQFRKQAISVGEKAQVLTVLSQVIRGEEYGYAEDEAYQRHADKLRDAGRKLNEAATEEDFQAAVKAAAAIQKACADCHGEYRG